MRTKLVLVFVIASMLLAGSCSRLDLLKTEPPVDPGSWLAAQPSFELTLGSLRFTIIQPSSSAIVYGLAAITIWAGIRFLRLRDGKRSRGYWGAALLVWGIGTFLAGTSYQAFGYEIKAAGRDVVLWTSAWEVAYMILTVAAVSLMTAGVAASSARGLAARLMRAWAILSAVAYTVFAVAGAVMPDRFMVSFEAMVLFAMPGMILCFVVNVVHWVRARKRHDLLLALAWLGMAVVMAAYFAAYLAGLGPALWRRGIWFSENDVLHVGLVAWMLYLALVVAPAMEDAA